MNDAEKILRFGFLVGGNAAIKPSDRTFHRFFHSCYVGRGGGDDVVQLHDYVGADAVLEGYGVFGCEKPSYVTPNYVWDLERRGMLGKIGGTPYIGVPSCGLKKRTPSSVTLANLSRLTI